MCERKCLNDMLCTHRSWHHRTTRRLQYRYTPCGRLAPVVMRRHCRDLGLQPPTAGLIGFGAQTQWCSGLRGAAFEGALGLPDEIQHANSIRGYFIGARVGRLDLMPH